MSHSSVFTEQMTFSKYHENDIGHGQFELKREIGGALQTNGARGLESGLRSQLVTQVTADTREEIFQNQREAALRRRKQQFQSGFIGHDNNRRVSGDGSFVPSVKNFSSGGEDYHMPRRFVDQRSHGETRSFVRRGSNYDNNDYSPQQSSKGFEFQSDSERGRNNLDHPESKFSQRRDPIFTNKPPESISLSERCTNTSKHLPQNQASQSYDDQTCLSDLSEYPRSGDNVGIPEVNRKGCLVKSPSTLSNMVTSNDERRTPMSNHTKINETLDSDNETGEDNNTVERNQETPLVEARDIKEIQHSFGENIDWENMKEVKNLLMKPVPKSAGMVQCYIKRNKGASRFLPEYRVYLKEGDRFMMTSRKRKKKKTSNYLISLSRNDHNKGSDKIIGKLRSNFMGTEFQIFDDGKNPKHQDPFYDEKNEEPDRKELGVILYGNNFGSSRGPRNMQVCINKISNEGEKCTKEWQPARKGEESMLQCFKQKTDSAMRHLVFLENRRPKWNEDMCAYVLNFNGRVTMASVKNFQLINSTVKGNANDNVTMQFGRTGDNEFIMDIQWPMSVFQAFAIALSSCDSKLACD